MTIGQKIKELRKQLNMSVDDLAAKLGKNRATIYRYEKGDIENLSLDVLEPLAKALETTPGYLMGWEAETISDNEFVQRKALHNERIENIRKQMRELEYTIPEREEYGDKIVLLSEALAALIDDSLDAEIKNEFLKRIIDKIEFSRENEVEFILDFNLH